MVSIQHLYRGSMDLSNREHYASWKQIESTALYLNIGIPPGSILVPLLFLIYTYDIVNSSNVQSFVLLLMTQGHIFKMILLTCGIEILNPELAKVALWFDSNKLTLKRK